MGVLKDLANLMGEMGGSLRSSYERENRKAIEAEKIEREKQRIAQVQQALAFMMQEYGVIVAELLYHAIENSAPATHISKPENIEALFSTLAAAQTPYGFNWLIYSGYYNRRLLRAYEITRQSISRILQEALDNMVNVYGFPYKLRIFVELGADSKIIFRIAFLQESINAMRGI